MYARSCCDGTARHPARSRDGSQRVRDIFAVARFNGVGEKFDLRFLGVEKVGGIEGRCFELHRRILREIESNGRRPELKIRRQKFRASDIALLRVFVAAANQNDDLCSAPNKIEPVSRPIVDAQFADAVANRLYVTEQARLQSNDSLRDPPPGVGVAKSGKPFLE